MSSWRPGCGGQVRGGVRCPGSRRIRPPAMNWMSAHAGATRTPGAPGLPEPGGGQPDPADRLVGPASLVVVASACTPAGDSRQHTTPPVNHATPSTGASVGGPPCTPSVDTLPAPPAGYRLVGEDVGAPDARVMSAEDSGEADPAARLFANGLVVRAGTVVDLRVAPGWQDKARLGWAAPARPRRPSLCTPARRRVGRLSGWPSSAAPGSRRPPAYRRRDVERPERQRQPRHRRPLRQDHHAVALSRPIDHLDVQEVAVLRRLGCPDFQKAEWITAGGSRRTCAAGPGSRRHSAAATRSMP